MKTVKFKIINDVKKECWGVEVYGTYRSLRSRWHTLNGKKIDSEGVAAFCTKFNKAIPQKDGTDCLGIICFTRVDINAEVIAHECVHAALQVARRRSIAKKLSNDRNAEERFATIVGDFTQVVTNGLKDRGVKNTKNLRSL